MYDESVRRLVAGWKERGLRKIADDAAALIVERLPRPAADLVTFVPADRRRRSARGHHPAERLARALAHRWQLPCHSLVLRTRETERQRGLTLADRRRNVAAAFAARAARGEILLVDDVYTSGATVSAAAAALRAAGAEHVNVMTFARAIRTGGLR